MKTRQRSQETSLRGTAALRTLRDEELSTVSVSGAVGFPSEAVAFTHGAIELSYTKHKPDGTAAGNVAAKWNVAQAAAA